MTSLQLNVIAEPDSVDLESSLQAAGTSPQGNIVSLRESEPASAASQSLQINDVRKRFGRFPALAGVSLEARDGEFLALLGPSGSGKTTLLRVLAGLEAPDSGSVRFKGEDLLAMPVRKRQIGMAFQHYALFRHMTAAQNIAFGLRAKRGRERPSSKDIAARVEKLLSLVQLEGLGGRYPAQLSGGQKQRIALARALAIEPKLLLLDEPFGALDAKVRRELRRWLRSLHEQTGLTTIFVTHDQEEALDLADRVAVLREGALEQVGTPQDLYNNPASPYVFEFLGDSVNVPCELVNGHAIIENVDAAIIGPAPLGGVLRAYIRPDDFELRSADTQGGFKARILAVLSAGPESRVVVEAETLGLVEIRVSHQIASKFIAKDIVRLAPKSVRVWPA